MKWFVWYDTGEYHPEFREFDTEEQVLELLNRYAHIPEFTFEVIEGRKVEYKPVQVATNYERKY